MTSRRAPPRRYTRGRNAERYTTTQDVVAPRLATPASSPSAALPLWVTSTIIVSFVVSFATLIIPVDSELAGDPSRLLAARPDAAYVRFATFSDDSPASGDMQHHAALTPVHIDIASTEAGSILPELRGQQPVPYGELGSPHLADDLRATTATTATSATVEPTLSADMPSAHTPSSTDSTANCVAADATLIGAPSTCLFLPPRDYGQRHSAGPCSDDDEHIRLLHQAASLLHLVASSSTSSVVASHASSAAFSASAAARAASARRGAGRDARDHTPNPTSGEPGGSRFPKTLFLTLLAALLILAATLSDQPLHTSNGHADTTGPAQRQRPLASGPAAPPASSVDERGLTVISFNSTDHRIGPDQVCPYASSRVHDALHPQLDTLLSPTIQTYLYAAPSRAAADERLGHPSTNLCPHLWLSIIFDVDLQHRRTSEPLSLAWLLTTLVNLATPYLYFAQTTILRGSYGVESIMRAGVTISDTMASHDLCTPSARVQFLLDLHSAVTSVLTNAGLRPIDHDTLLRIRASTPGDADLLAPSDHPPFSGYAYKSLQQAYLIDHSPHLSHSQPAARDAPQCYAPSESVDAPDRSQLSRPYSPASARLPAQAILILFLSALLVQVAGASATLIPPIALQGSPSPSPSSLSRSPVCQPSTSRKRRLASPDARATNETNVNDDSSIQTWFMVGDEARSWHPRSITPHDYLIWGVPDSPHGHAHFCPGPRVVASPAIDSHFIINEVNNAAFTADLTSGTNVCAWILRHVVTYSPSEHLYRRRDRVPYDNGHLTLPDMQDHRVACWPYPTLPPPTPLSPSAHDTLRASTASFGAIVAWHLDTDDTFLTSPPRRDNTSRLRSSPPYDTVPASRQRSRILASRKALPSALLPYTPLSITATRPLPYIPLAPHAPFTGSTVEQGGPPPSSSANRSSTCSPPSPVHFAASYQHQHLLDSRLTRNNSPQNSIQLFLLLLVMAPFMRIGHLRGAVSLLVARGVAAMPDTPSDDSSPNDYFLFAGAASLLVASASDYLREKVRRVVSPDEASRRRSSNAVIERQSCPTRGSVRDVVYLPPCLICTQRILRACHEFVIESFGTVCTTSEPHLYFTRPAVDDLSLVTTANTFSLEDDEYILYAPITHSRRYSIHSIYGEEIAAIIASPGDLVFIKSHVRHKENDLYDHDNVRSRHGPERVDARAFIKINGLLRGIFEPPEPPSFRCGRASSPHAPDDFHEGLHAIQTILKGVVDAISHESSISEGQRFRMLSNGWTEDLDAEWRGAVSHIRPYPFDSLLFDVHNCLNQVLKLAVHPNRAAAMPITFFLEKVDQSLSETEILCNINNISDEFTRSALEATMTPRHIEAGSKRKFYGHDIGSRFLDMLDRVGPAEYVIPVWGREPRHYTALHNFLDDLQRVLPERLCSVNTSLRVRLLLHHDSTVGRSHEELHDVVDLWIDKHPFVIVDRIILQDERGTRLPSHDSPQPDSSGPGSALRPRSFLSTLRFLEQTSAWFVLARDVTGPICIDAEIESTMAAIGRIVNPSPQVEAVFKGRSGSSTPARKLEGSAVELPPNDWVVFSPRKTRLDAITGSLGIVCTASEGKFSDSALASFLLSSPLDSEYEDDQYLAIRYGGDLLRISVLMSSYPVLPSSNLPTLKSLIAQAARPRAPSDLPQQLSASWRQRDVIIQLPRASGRLDPPNFAFSSERVTNGVLPGIWVTRFRGIDLELSASSPAGYEGVSILADENRPSRGTATGPATVAFESHYCDPDHADEPARSLGVFATAEEASLHLTVHSNRMLLAKGRHIHPGEVTDLSNYEGGLESVDMYRAVLAASDQPMAPPIPPSRLPSRSASRLRLAGSTFGRPSAPAPDPQSRPTTRPRPSSATNPEPRSVAPTDSACYEEWSSIRERWSRTRERDQNGVPLPRRESYVDDGPCPPGWPVDFPDHPLCLGWATYKEACSEKEARALMAAELNDKKEAEKHESASDPSVAVYPDRPDDEGRPASGPGDPLRGCADSGASSSSAAPSLRDAEPTPESDAAKAERTARLNIDDRRLLDSFRGVALHHDRNSKTGYRNVQRRPDGKFAAIWLTRFPHPILLSVRNTAVEAALVYADCVRGGGPDTTRPLPRVTVNPSLAQSSAAAAETETPQLS